MSAYLDVPRAGEILLSPEPKQHCAICNQAAPMVVAPVFNRHGYALTPDAGGWMHLLFPFPTLADRRQPWDYMREAQLFCPPCAADVAKFIAHKRQPMRTEYENL